MSVDFTKSLAECSEKVGFFILQDKFTQSFAPENLREAVLAYPRRSGKRLRSAVLLWCCGAVGGDMDSALPAAGAVEMFHSWTLVHDDLIDDDSTRRGGPTVHVMARDLASQKMGYSESESLNYGRDIAVLAGDCQHGWTVTMLCDCAQSGHVDPRVVIELISSLESRVVSILMEGETLDVQFSKLPIDTLTDEGILRMLWMKTGVLYEFAAEAGTMIGLNTPDHGNPMVRALTAFAGGCGTAFQLQDDILGIVGDEKKLGKPVGSDLREGKKTLPVYYALSEGKSTVRDAVMSVLGNKNASEADISHATQAIVSSGAIQRTEELSVKHIRSAVEHLKAIPESIYKDLLHAWSDFLIARSF